METQTTQKTTFTRKGAALDYKPMSVKEGQTRFVQIVSPKISDIYLKMKGENVPAILVKDLESNEQRVLFLSGKLLQKVKVLQLAGPLAGKRVEISNSGTQPIEMGEETWDVTNYELYELN